MTSVRGHRASCRESSSVTPSIAPYIVSPDSSSSSKSGNKLSDQLVRPLEIEPPVADAPVTATNVLKYSKSDLQRIFKAVLEAQAAVSVAASAPTSAPALAPIVSKAFWEKLKASSLHIYYGKSYMDCYNFCQQCENYFATARATGPTQIPFAVSFLRDQISFRWQQYKQRHHADTSVTVM